MKNDFELEAFKKLLAIPSVKGEKTADAPFGKEVKKALGYFLSLASSYGFETKNYDNYIGEVVFGEGEPFGILCHLDVVPTGNPDAWQSPPFEPTERDGNLYCRGVLDDKCGAICSLFAIKRLKDEGVIPKNKIKLILGCDEESGWGCIDYYNAHATLPEVGISPDADFPVIYAEKGILHAEFKFEKKKGFSLSAGTRANVVCDHCEFTLNENADDQLAKSLNIKKTGDRYESFGVAAHGSTPDKGENALDPALKYLAKLGYIDEKHYNDLFLDAQGAKNLEDETGKLTFSPDVARTDDKYLYVTVDIRYPSTIDRAVVDKYLEKIGEYSEIHWQRPLFVDKESKLVKILLKVYNEVTGENAKPIAIGGGTYARALKCGVAFGPSFGAEGDTVHQPNEYMPIENFYKLTDILYKAIKELCCQ